MRIRITEVGPRDGLQNIKIPIPTDAKVRMVDILSDSGVEEIEVSSFVSPRWVPQLADAEEVFRRIRRKEGVIYSALVPNLKGLERALSVGVDKIAVFTAASETFNMKNTNATIEESIERFIPVVREAKNSGLMVRGYVSTAFHCYFEGKIPPQKVLDVVNRLFDIGVDEVSLGDTIGRAVPNDVRELMEVLLNHHPAQKMVLHFHDTYGTGIANVWTAYSEFGVHRFDSSAGGLGGCPFVPGASGNVATEDVVFLFEQSGVETGVDIHRVVEGAKAIVDATDGCVRLQSHISRVIERGRL